MIFHGFLLFFPENIGVQLRQAPSEEDLEPHGGLPSVANLANLLNATGDTWIWIWHDMAIYIYILLFIFIFIMYAGFGCITSIITYICMYVPFVLF